MSHAESDQRTLAALLLGRLVRRRPSHRGRLYKGMRQRIKLAQAIAHDPQVVVLDDR